MRRDQHLGVAGAAVVTDDNPLAFVPEPDSAASGLGLWEVADTVFAAAVLVAAGAFDDDLVSDPAGVAAVVVAVVLSVSAHAGGLLDKTVVGKTIFGTFALVTLVAVSA